MLQDITFIEGAMILIGLAVIYWCVGQVVNRAWRRWLNRYLDRYPDVEEDLYHQYGKVRVDKPWDAVRVDENGRALESSGEWLNRLGVPDLTNN